MDYQWKILEVFAHDGLITHVRYHLTAIDGEHQVNTEGTHYFKDQTIKKPFEEVKESDICSWIDQDTIQEDISSIKLNLADQIELLKNNKKVEFPWLANTFTID